MDYFKSVSIKFERLKKQIVEIDNLITEFTNLDDNCPELIMKDENCGFIVKNIDSTNLSHLDETSIQIGEFIHNMRSLLDNFIFALARLECDPPLKPHKLQFPIYLDINEYNKRCSVVLNQIPYIFREFVTMLQPFNRDNEIDIIKPKEDPLYLIGYLSNFDKHRMPIFLSTQIEKINGNIDIEYVNKENCTNDDKFKIDFKSEPLAKDSIIVECFTGFPIKLVRINTKFETTIGLEIEGKYYELIPLLSSLLNYYALIFTHYDNYRKKYEKTENSNSK